MFIKILKIVVGIIVLVIGLAGLAIPILPGWALIFVGILLISPHHGKKIIEWIKGRVEYYRKTHFTNDNEK